MLTIGNDIFGNPIPVPLKHKGRPKVNPCIAVFGPGPDGVKCGSCRFHYFKLLANKYPKCEKRGKETGSAKTDHSSRYPACGIYQPETK